MTDPTPGPRLWIIKHLAFVPNSALRFFAGELRHVGVQRKDLHPRRPQRKRRIHRHGVVLRPVDEHHHRRGIHAPADRLPRLRNHPPLQRQLLQGMTVACNQRHTMAPKLFRYTTLTTFKQQTNELVGFTVQYGPHHVAVVTLLFVQQT